MYIIQYLLACNHISQNLLFITNLAGRLKYHFEDKRNYFSHFWDRPVPIFSDVRFFYLALVRDKKIVCVLPANACCTVYVNCPPQFSMLFLFEINNSLYISFQSFINMQILTISHIILFQSMFVYFE
jgi:hypothetical protein